MLGQLIESLESPVKYVPLDKAPEPPAALPQTPAVSSDSPQTHAAFKRLLAFQEEPISIEEDAKVRPGKENIHDIDC